MTTALLAGMALGAVGSGHCLAMCGPLALTVGRSTAGDWKRRVRHAALYHGGRTFTYAVLGAAAGQVGYGLVAAGLGRPLAILAAAALLLIGAGRFLPGQSPLVRAWTALAAAACAKARHFSLRHAVVGPLASGAANGLLPCGLVYAAVTAATALAAAGYSAVFMMGFGAGTIPALAALTLSAAHVPRTVQDFARRATPVVLTAIAALLIVRGLGAMPAVISACHGHLH